MLRNRLLPFLLALLLCIPVRAWGQGYSSFNGRNHPELKWQFVESEHFRIMFPQRIAGIENQAAQIAEESYEALSKNLDVTFDRKIRIYLSDEDEITNGFAVPIQSGHTNIWVNLNDALNSWTGEEKWMRKVIAHELGHIFHYRAIRSNIHPIDFAISNPIPSFWAEGLAQYQTEKWDAFRGDRWLRTAVLDDKLSYNDGRSSWNGRLLYSVGNSQLRYFADRFGDSTLTALLKHREPALLGLAKVHNFESAFEAVTDMKYPEFYDDWRRHINIYYNSIASQMENADSLRADEVNLPGQYLYDVKISPDSSKVAIVALTSLNRPVRRLYILDTHTEETIIAAEGNIRVPVAWSPDSRRVFYASQVRSQHGSLLNDVFVYDVPTKTDLRLTTGRRANFPTASPDGLQIAYAATNGPTTNIYTAQLSNLQEKQVTRYSGDVQIGHLAWSPNGSSIAYSLFDQAGERTIQTVDVRSLQTRAITGGQHDDRQPTWSPSGDRIAFTSYRDGVPNVFTMRVDTVDSVKRVTNLVTGATIHDWLPGGVEHTRGLLAVIVGESKTSDTAYLVDAARVPYTREIQLPAQYDRWTRVAPEQTIPSFVHRPDVKISAPKRYRSVSNISHVFSLPFPYYGTAENWGIGGVTSWTEPLSRHSIFAGGLFSIPKPANSTLYIAYVNNTLAPSIQTEVSYIPGAARPYENTILEERASQAEVKIRWPISSGISPYRQTYFSVRSRFLNVDIRNPEDFIDQDSGLPVPESGEQYDLRVSFTRKFQRPYRFNVVHPLDGSGIRVRLSGGFLRTDENRRFVQLDLSAYRIFPALGLNRILVYSRMQTQRGRGLAQNFQGLSRYDALQIHSPNFVQAEFSNSERVRGYRSFALGQTVVFGSLEYRIPVVPSLRTTLLGSVSLGSTSLALFADGGLVFDDVDYGDAIKRLGVGMELKNELRLGSNIRFMHAVGIAGPANDLGRDTYDLYYRIRTTLPF